jgi:hypothetical protein
MGFQLAVGPVDDVIFQGRLDDDGRYIQAQANGQNE